MLQFKHEECLYSCLIKSYKHQLDILKFHFTDSNMDRSSKANILDVLRFKLPYSQDISNGRFHFRLLRRRCMVASIQEVRYGNRRHTFDKSRQKQPRYALISTSAGLIWASSVSSGGSQGGQSSGSPIAWSAGVGRNSVPAS
jgi:hypothetical protein